MSSLLATYSDTSNNSVWNSSLIKFSAANNFKGVVLGNLSNNGKTFQYILTLQNKLITVSQSMVSMIF
jgi:hypothetical protein